MKHLTVSAESKLILCRCILQWMSKVQTCSYVLVVIIVEIYHELRESGDYCE